MTVWAILILVLGALLLGYLWGKRIGMSIGEELGRSLAPLELREKSLQKGYCILCRTYSQQNPYHSSMLML